MTRDLHRLVRAGVALAGAAGLVWFVGCSDNPPGPCFPACPPPPSGVIVSDPGPAGTFVTTAAAVTAVAHGALDDVAHVSVAPGTVPAGNQAIVRRVGDAASLATAVTNGGFDPVPVVAAAGDSIEVTVTDTGGATLLEVRVAVAAARPPVIVRTEPPPRKRDVPLNATIVIVFSEPVDGSTLNASSVQLLRGSTPVAGTVSLLPGSGTAAAFIPSAPLNANTDYRLVVTQGVQDLDGDALEADVTVEFTTGATQQTSVASVSVLPDSAQLFIGTQLQLTATARDAQENVLAGLPVTWTSGDSLVATVSTTGLVTALAEGVTTISAEVEGVIGVSHVSTYGLAFAVQPSNVVAGATIAPAVVVRARDALGNTVVSFTGNVEIQFGANPGNGTLSGVTTVQAVAGVATFASLSIDASGIGYTLSATSGLASTTSATFDVTAGPARSLTFTVQPRTTTVGAAISPSIMVVATDTFGNTATTFTGNVTIAIGTNPANGTLSGTTTVAAVAGVTAFSTLSIDAPGTGYTLIAAASGLASTTSDTFAVTPGPATQLVFTVQPSSTSAGATIAPGIQVAARDALGNMATSFTGNITIAIGTNPANGTLSGTTTIVAVSGAAVFSDLSIDAPGTGYTLIAAASGLNIATSAPFDITAP